MLQENKTSPTCVDRDSDGDWMMVVMETGWWYGNLLHPYNCWINVYTNVYVFTEYNNLKTF